MVAGSGFSLTPAGHASACAGKRRLPGRRLEGTWNIFLLVYTLWYWRANSLDLAFFLSLSIYLSLFLPLSFSLYLSFSLSLYLSISPPPFSINLSIPFSFYFLAILFLNQTIMKANLTKLSPTKGPIANSPLTFVDWCVYTSTSMGLFLSMGASGFLPNWLEVSRNSSLGAAPISTRT